MCQEEKIIFTSEKGCKIDAYLLFKKNTEAVTGGAETVTRGILWKRFF